MTVSVPRSVIAAVLLVLVAGTAVAHRPTTAAPTTTRVPPTPPPTTLAPTPPPTPPPTPTPSGPAAALAALKAGGAVLVMRHGATNSNQADVDPLHLEDCTKQRQLNQAGRSQASTTAVLLWLHGVSITNLTTSRYCRAIETGARIAEPFGLTPSASDDFAEGGQVVTPTENRRRTAAMQAAANNAPAAPGNAFIVSHKPNIVDAFGCEFLNVSEGEMAVFKPSPSGVAQLVGRLKVADLVALLP